jgi:hypothetical protein
VICVVQINEGARIGYAPLIDEWVAGSGNDDIGLPDCDTGKQGGCSSRPGILFPQSEPEPY